MKKYFWQPYKRAKIVHLKQSTVTSEIIALADTHCDINIKIKNGCLENRFHGRIINFDLSRLSVR